MIDYDELKAVSSSPRHESLDLPMQAQVQTEATRSEDQARARPALQHLLPRLVGGRSADGDTRGHGCQRAASCTEPCLPGHKREDQAAHKYDHQDCSTEINRRERSHDGHAPRLWVQRLLRRLRADQDISRVEVVVEVAVDEGRLSEQLRELRHGKPIGHPQCLDVRLGGERHGAARKLLDHEPLAAQLPVDPGEGHVRVLRALRPG
mmetsp:Transcript_77243/g.226535  ORF Transcript_77243/g.226535 Transcript_77243/m.226535 type:complete len:207 (-) Transcript_77243:1163-1783(-)